jgi:hypothetical protein
MEVERAEVVDFTVDLVVGFCVRRVRDDLNDDMMFVLLSSISCYGRRGKEEKPPPTHTHTHLQRDDTIINLLLLCNNSMVQC